jgi:hypothetical protein
MRAKFTVLLIAVVAAGATIQGVASSPAATERIPYLWQRCSHVNAKYPHGVGRRFAHDHTSGTPVTNFYRSTRLYLVAMSYNRGLDRDKDGIACEKR